MTADAETVRELVVPRLPPRGEERRSAGKRNDLKSAKQMIVIVVITVGGDGSGLCSTGESERPGGGMRGLGGGPQFLEGQGLAVISERVLL